ncbi:MULTISPECIES: Na+/H+ antiporter NhaA [Pseudonocardia]|uniref:Na(+)/H(+) antiporter NhaA n=2 Tax=Pseudonocardia TaxID=1847 RepID=A0A1Y2N6T3_PSEAH|nr:MULTISPECIES: Na+/H+ antiporter NhaA [Pseudonocardia]OSY43186.1 Na(+)/H(+) antiporter NhaA [Pseudonocardia autotrophica]TDN71674.1 sodium/proton antiporter (NhaA family) [Pseudonocardia autotrophica]BBG02361.1 Na(+)/H(+) antiporter NhaA [Pseudonocardia autotrophica]GEC23303.1 Na(+)/H(+) antiporter NhaA [Pseudonocardia saturnea]
MPADPRSPVKTSHPLTRIADALRGESVGGFLLVGAAVLALVLANSPWRDAYFALSGFSVGPAALHLDLTVATWAADGLLAIFFFVVGLELKREFLAGDLRDPAKAVLPVAAAVGGMIAPALIYVAINLANPDALVGWAIPTATDIAFALAVLAVIGSSLPPALRMFLLTLAVVDDLLAISIIAVFYTDDLSFAPLLLALVPLGLFALAVQRGLRAWWLLLPLAALTWALVHACGVHATVAGVLLGFTVPVLARRGERPDPGRRSPAERIEHLVRPISAGIAVPVFAFFAAGVSVVDGGGIGAALADPVTQGIIAGLVLGKTVGVLGSTWLVQRFTRARLSDDLGWWDLLGLAQLAGIGFTVSLLVGELAFGTGTPEDDHVKIGVLTGSVTAVLLATVLLRIRNAHHRRLAEDRERS